jgi:hypothetical protein
MRKTIYSLSLLVLSGRAHNCQDLCDGLPSCSKGSYCKSWQSIPVCFGLYFVDPVQQTMCYFPDDDQCPEAYPVECPTDHPETVQSNPLADARNMSSNVELDDPAISLAKTEINATLEVLASTPNNTARIEVFDWIPDVSNASNTSLQSQL